MSQLPDWRRLLIVIYHEHALDSLLEVLLAGFVLWGLYVWQGRNKLGVWGFPCWFPLLLSATAGSALLLRRITGPVAVAVPPTMYLYPVALLIALLTQPVFKRQAGFIAAQVVMALIVLAAFLWVMWLVVEPLLLEY